MGLNKSMNLDNIEKNLIEVKKLIEENGDHIDNTINVFMDNFQRFSDRITKIEMKLFGKSDD